MDARLKRIVVGAMLMALSGGGCASGTKHGATTPAILPVVVTQGTLVPAPSLAAVAPLQPSDVKEPAQNTIVLVTATEPAAMPGVPLQPLPEAISRGEPIAKSQTFTLAD